MDILKASKLPKIFFIENGTLQEAYPFKLVVTHDEKHFLCANYSNDGVYSVDLDGCFESVQDLLDEMDGLLHRNDMTLAKALEYLERQICIKGKECHNFPYNMSKFPYEDTFRYERVSELAWKKIEKERPELSHPNTFK